MKRAAIFSRPYNTPPDIKACREGFDAGLKEGARREWRALKREAGLFPEHSRYRQWVMNWLASRKRKGGKK